MPTAAVAFQPHLHPPFPRRFSMCFSTVYWAHALGRLAEIQRPEEEVDPG